MCKFREVSDDLITHLCFQHHGQGPRQHMLSGDLGNDAETRDALLSDKVKVEHLEQETPTPSQVGRGDFPTASRES